MRESKTEGLNTALLEKVLKEHFVYSEKPLKAVQRGSFGVFVNLVKLELNLDTEDKIDSKYIRLACVKYGINFHMDKRNFKTTFTNYQSRLSASNLEVFGYNPEVHAKAMHDTFWQPRKELHAEHWRRFFKFASQAAKELLGLA